MDSFFLADKVTMVTSTYSEDIKRKYESVLRVSKNDVIIWDVCRF